MLYQHGWTALATAVVQGCNDSIQPLLAAGSDPNKEVAEGYPPLIVALAKGHTAIVRTLLAGVRM